MVLGSEQAFAFEGAWLHKQSFGIKYKQKIHPLVISKLQYHTILLT
jgi:hypothetical protein